LNYQQQSEANNQDVKQVGVMGAMASSTTNWVEQRRANGKQLQSDRYGKDLKQGAL